MRVAASSPHARLAAPPSLDGDGDVAVVFGGEPAPDGAREIVRWDAGGPAQAAAPGERRIAPEGEGLWRRAPWPAADELFEMRPPESAEAVLVAGGSAARREELRATLAGPTAAVDVQELLSPPALERAATVVLLPAPGVPGAALPLETMAVLAARRLLIAPAATVRFGLMPGVDYLDFTLSTEVATLLQARRRNLAIYESMRAWGLTMARRHRSSDALSALATNLRLGL